MNCKESLLIAGGTLLLVAPFFISAQQAAPPAATAPGGRVAGRGGFAPRAQPFDYSDNENWISLFNGQNLNGWDGDMRYWSVKDDSIYIEPSCEHPTGTIYLVWQGGDVADFMLKFESKGTMQVNGGVQFRSYLTADNNVGLKYPPRASGRGGAGRGTPPAGNPTGTPAVAGRGPGGGGGRGPQCANPGTPPTAAEKAKWDMAGPQFDFDAHNQYPGQYYEQSSIRSIAAPPGTVVLAERGQRRLVATLSDQATRDSWYKKDDYNQFLLIAKGNTTTMYMNGHLMSVFIDNDPDYFRPTGKIGLEVESTGAYFTKNIFLKRM